jgi:hypothetical protein
VAEVFIVADAVVSAAVAAVLCGGLKGLLSRDQIYPHCCALVEILLRPPNQLRSATNHQKIYPQIRGTGVKKNIERSRRKDVFRRHRKIVKICSENSVVMRKPKYPNKSVTLLLQSLSAKVSNLRSVHLAARTITGDLPDGHPISVD